MNKISNNIRFLRRQQNLKQSQLADILGFARSTYASYENGRAVPNIQHLENISNYFRISIDRIAKEDMTNVLMRDDADFEKSEKKEGECPDESPNASPNEALKSNDFNDFGHRVELSEAEADYKRLEGRNSKDLMLLLLRGQSELQSSINGLRATFEAQTSSSLRLALDREIKYTRLLEEKLKALESDRSEITQKKNGN